MQTRADRTEKAAGFGAVRLALVAAWQTFTDWLEDGASLERDLFLSRATSHADLERRMTRWGRAGRGLA